MKKLSVGLGAALLLTASFAATPVSAQDDLTIASSMPALEFPFFVHMMSEVRAEAEAIGGITLIESDGENSAPKQTGDVEAAVIQGVDGIIISPIDAVAMAPAIAAAVEAGIPVRQFYKILKEMAEQEEILEPEDRTAIVLSQKKTFP